ncbi:Aste57867_2185 [Aphanomyces stellatus]|uniref:Aste57867_2185 protein n=1 Tax=Aphanomyces stellatus TaxID=120398 RepID=A0A485K732_9STRA|nr:hypothetical protein As57867_002180 [Aphanomyces stellatus]VFT79388.1 Aste57867_2185 [Aphanomyces stellatus]
MITNIISDQFEMSEDDITADSDYTRNQVATSFATYYCFTLLTSTLVVFYPTQKKILQERREYPKVGSAALIDDFLRLGHGRHVQLVTMFQSTKCCDLPATTIAVLIEA